MILSLFFLLVCPGLSPAASGPSFPDPGRIQYPSLSFHIPEVERARLDNGIRLFILPETELPLIQVKVVVGTGNMYDPIGQEGLTELTAATMRTGGKAGMSGDAFDEALESIAANFNVSSNRDSVIFSFSVFKKNLDRGLDLFFGTLLQPSFGENRLTLAKDLKIEELRRIVDDPKQLAFREFGRLMHEASLRGRLATVESIRSIQREDLLHCYRRFFHPENIMISITGDVERKEAKDLVNRYLGTWRAPGEKTVPPPPPLIQKGNIFFLTKETSQSTVIIGWLAPAKRDVRHYPFEVLDFIIGSGGFRSRIFQEIRTNMGWAYSTGSFYRANPDYGLFGVYASTKSESTVKVTARIQDIIRDMGEKLVSPMELEGAQKAIQNSFIFSFKSAEQVSLQQLMIEYDRLPDDYLATYRTKIGKVTSQNIRENASQYLSITNAIILIVGSEQVYRDLAANFGKVTRIQATF